MILPKKFLQGSFLYLAFIDRKKQDSKGLHKAFIQ